jgi:hypothetical protein
MDINSPKDTINFNLNLSQQKFTSQCIIVVASGKDKENNGYWEVGSRSLLMKSLFCSPGYSLRMGTRFLSLLYIFLTFVCIKAGVQ